MSTAAWSKRSIWEQRIERATLKAQERPWAAELLGFYVRILECQNAVYESVRHTNPPANTEPQSLRQSLDLRAAAASLPALLEAIERYAPAKLRHEAEEFGSLSQEQILDRLQKFIHLSPDGEDPGDFFALAVLQPLAEWAAKDNCVKDPGIAANQCPCCGGGPQLVVLRPEGDGGKRWLLCSFCQTEWEFNRILCPSCGELDNTKLPHFSGEGDPAVRVEACDSCLTYFKSFDLTVDGMIVPLVDDIATAPLDIWAAEKGYRKAKPNLLGF